MIIRWTAVADEVDGVDRAAYGNAREAFLARAGSDLEAEYLFPPLEQIPSLVDRKPLFDRIIAGTDELWIRHFTEGSLGLMDSRMDSPPAPPERWSVLSTSGGWIGTFDLPARFELRAIGRDALYGIVRDELDVQMVGRIEKDWGAPTGPRPPGSLPNPRDVHD